MHIIIIGNGIAGSTAARYIRKYSDHRITMISDESAYPYARTSLMYLFMGHVRLQDILLYEPTFWEKNRINLLQDRVLKVLPAQHTIETQNHGVLHYDRLILATGSTYRVPPVPGVSCEGVQGLYHLSDISTLESMTIGLKQAVITGGGLIGVELAEMLHSRRVAVTMLVREPHYWGNVLPTEEALMVETHLRHKGVHLLTNTRLERLEDDGHGRVATAITHRGERIPCQFAGLTIGVSPAIGLAIEAGIETQEGILVDDYLRTSLPDIYAVGDCAQIRLPMPGRQPIEAVWFTGKLMGRVAAANICGQPAVYQPGHWYNASRFFDLSYQTYGHIAIQSPASNTFLWQDQHSEQSFRIQFDAGTGQIQGFLVMGISLRHRVADRMLREAWTLPQAVSHLDALLFEPPLASSPMQHIRQACERQFPDMPLTIPHRKDLTHLIHS